jgi:hypothetical protein
MGKRDRERKERIRAGEEASIATPQPGFYLETELLL